MNFNRFYAFTCQKSNNRSCSSLVHVSSGRPSLYCYYDTTCSSALFCHLLDIPYTTSNNIANLQDSGFKIRIFITNLRLSFGWPAYFYNELINGMKYWRQMNGKIQTLQAAEIWIYQYFSNSRYIFLLNCGNECAYCI
jgi:hypothetical protein